MLSLLAAELEQAFYEITWDDDLSYFAYHTGKAGGVSTAIGVVGVHTFSLSDDISEACESIVAMAEALESSENHYADDEDDEDDFDEVVFTMQNLETNFFYIFDKITERLESGQETEPHESAPDIGWAEYGAALNEAVRARDDDDWVRYRLMMGFVSGLMFNDPGPRYEGRSILDAINEAYETGSDESLDWARARIAAGVRMTDPSPFIGKEQYDRYMEDKLRTLRWVQNFGLHHARAGDDSVEVPGSMAINHAVRQMKSQEPVENPPRPIEMCYWVVPGKLLAGEYPRNLDEASSREKLARLTDADVSAFIDLTEADEHLEPYAYLLNGPSHQRFAIRDMSVPSSRELTKAALDAIDGHLAGGRTVYVHCWGGVGRTGTIIGCWLARHYEPGQAALDRLKELWRENPKSRRVRRSPETDALQRYVREWNEDVRDAEGAETSAERLTDDNHIANDPNANFEDLPQEDKDRYRDDRIVNESSANFADFPEEVKDWYRKVALARVEAHRTGDFSELIALGAWPSEEDEAGWAESEEFGPADE